MVTYEVFSKFIMFQVSKDEGKICRKAAEKARWALATKTKYLLIFGLTMYVATCEKD
jgi:hypothetical protein